MARILVIDDVAGVRRSIGALLSRGGHEVELAEDGQSGVERARQMRPDIVFVDMLMPEQDGVETLEQIRKEKLAGASVAMSGGGFLVGAEDALSAGALISDAAVSKPFENQELLDLVERLVPEACA
ncbi:response regulator [Maricaulaceae bacterium EIL42A08]|nr:response regulator [Maricaulaceae bacterium EIL42A08]